MTTVVVQQYTCLAETQFNNQLGVGERSGSGGNGLRGRDEHGDDSIGE